MRCSISQDNYNKVLANKDPFPPIVPVNVGASLITPNDPALADFSPMAPAYAARHARSTMDTAPPGLNLKLNSSLRTNASIFSFTISGIMLVTTLFSH
jgi:hypothetical protein